MNQVVLTMLLQPRDLLEGAESTVGNTVESVGNTVGSLTGGLTGTDSAAGASSSGAAGSGSTGGLGGLIPVVVRALQVPGP